MDEYATSTYEWLSNEVDVPILGPETAEGKHKTRAEWAKRGVADLGRVGVFDVGGITPARKVAALYESFYMECEHTGTPSRNSTTSVRWRPPATTSSTASSTRSTTTRSTRGRS